MENHPIPQDVTGFKFRIIGSVTIKQFGYILAAGVLCLLVFLMHINILLTIPLMLLFGGLGLGLAFVPIEGRPMDKMIVSFVKALPKENQYVFHKKGVNLAEMEMFKPLKPAAPKAQQQTSTTDQTKKRELASLLRNSTFRPEEDEMEFFKNIKTEFDNPNAAVKPILPATPLQEKPLMSATATKPVALPNVQVAPAEEVVQTTAVSKASLTFNTPPQETAQPVVKTPIQADTVHPLAAPAPTVQSQSPIATKPIPAIQNSANLISSQVQPSMPQPTPVHNPEPVSTTSTVASDPNSQLNAGFPILPDIPNIVLGIVRDPRGKALQYILVEVLDQNDIPVRAFKTNQLGQFAAATPLANGTYKVIFEDSQKKHEFSPIEITLDGTSIFQPLIIVSVDQREKLRRELFGGGQQVTSP